MRASLKQVSKQTKQPHEKLTLSDKPPQALFYLWEIFLQLYKFGQFISFQELQAWGQLMNHSLNPAEIGIVKHLDLLANAR